MDMPDKILNQVSGLLYGIRYGTYELADANQALREKFPDFELGRVCYEFFHGRSAPCENCPMGRVQAGEKNVGLSLWLSKADAWLQVQFDDVVNEKGEHICMCTAVDITGVKEAILRMEKVLNGINAAAYTVGMNDHRLHMVNSFLKNILPDIQEGELCYKALWDRDTSCEHCPLTALTEEHSSGSMELYNTKLKRHLSIDSVRVWGSNGEPEAIFTAYDITRRVESEERLKTIAYRDIQLGVKNAAAFMEEMATRFKDGKKHYVFLTRLKNLDNYNLIYGRKAGDKLLRTFCDNYRLYCNPDLIYRAGGAKLAFIADDEESYQRLEEMLRRPVPEEVQNRHKNFHFYIDSVVLEIPRFAGNPEALMHNSEYMLYKNRDTDIDQIMYFCSEEQEALERKNQLTEVVRNKVRTKGFEVYYQPIYDIERGCFSKCEALARLTDEKLGAISPVEFIPIVEECGLINELGLFVLEEACKLIVYRKEHHLPPVLVNVNVSTIQFSSESFYDTVMGTVNRYGIDRSLLQLEVTESILINSFDYIVDLMKRLIEQGILFVVDDFGTGYSSLSYIGTLPVVGLKLDKSFIDKIGYSEVYVLIVKNVMEIAKGLNFKIVAEGVEQYGQYQILKKLGCEYIQGYLFSKPLPAEAFHHFLDWHYDMPEDLLLKK